MPYKFSTEYSKHPAGNPDDKLIEFDCAQNNRDLNDNGQQIMNLTMPIDAPSQPVLIPKSTRGSHKHDGE